MDLDLKAKNAHEMNENVELIRASIINPALTLTIPQTLTLLLIAKEIEQLIGLLAA